MEIGKDPKPIGESMERFSDLFNSRFVFDMIDREYWKALPEYEWIHRYHYQEIKSIRAIENDIRWNIEFLDGMVLESISGTHIFLTSKH